MSDISSRRPRETTVLSPPSTRIARGGVRGERSSLSRSGVGDYPQETLLQ